MHIHPSLGFVGENPANIDPVDNFGLSIANLVTSYITPANAIIPDIVIVLFRIAAGFHIAVDFACLIINLACTLTDINPNINSANTSVTIAAPAIILRLPYLHYRVLQNPLVSLDHNH